MKKNENGQHIWRCYGRKFEAYFFGHPVCLAATIGLMNDMHICNVSSKPELSEASTANREVQFRGAPDLDPDPAGYPVFFQDPVGSKSGWIQTVWIRSTRFITM